MKKRSILALLAALALMLSACSHPASDNDPVTTEDSKNTDTTTGTVSTGDSQAASSDLFTDRDFRTEYEDGIAITLSGSSAACDDKSVEISGSTITIKDEGTYVLSGKLDDGMVIVDTDKNTKVQLVLNGADEGTATITGGTFIGTGASTMAQTFSSSEQGVIALKVGSQSAGTELVLTDASGNEILSYTPNLSYQIAILSSPDMVKGESYTIQIGTATGTFEAS